MSKNDPLQAIESVSSSERRENPYSKYLRAQEEYLNEVACMEIEEIVVKLSVQSEQLYHGRRIEHINLRQLMESIREGTLKEKNDVLGETRGLYLASTGAVIEIVGVAMGSGLSVVAQAFTHSKSHHENSVRQRETLFDHMYQRYGNTSGEHGQQSREAKQASEQAFSLIDRIIQTMSRQSQMVFSASS